MADAMDLDQQAAALFLQAFGAHPGFRLTHAKGIVCEGVFTPTKAAAELSRAAHFNNTVPIVVRFSHGTGLPQIPDGDSNGNPKGMAIRFKLPDGGITDIVSNGLAGFVTSTPADFVSFFRSALASPPDAPKPTPLDLFLAEHPTSIAHLSKPNLTPASFVTQTYFGNNAFIFVNALGQRRATRYQIVPASGERHLTPEIAAAKPPNFLSDELKERLAKGPAEFRLLVQLAEPGDPTSDVQKLWPEERTKVEIGTLRITAIDPKGAESEQLLTFDPTHLTDGIELSDDPLPAFRAKVYSISIARRQARA